MGSVLQACLNGAREPGSHPSLPITPQQLAADAAACAELGVTSFHLHPRDAVGLEVLAGPEVATAVSVVRTAVAGARIGVTTGAWIVPDPLRRAELVRGWAGLSAGRPDFASVNVHEDGWLAVAAALCDAGVGIELGVFHLEAARTLLDAGVPAGTVRVLAEVQPGQTAQDAARLVDALAPLGVPILLHGEDDSAWPVLDHAVAHGLDTRIGLEDTLTARDGTEAVDNAALVRLAL
ncbi:3-keto-5-aminohexanoate cleavage protein [Saccharothrix sp. S26]|uniref:3-keto-5-aminohexanoate cleavage protein n=1 Tax=Saccharothrix sp. S26 TaxID=2907215 RepID=UPI001F357537|nr:3-keto-5-aminohexanoate cleavage protein [Saccharothrix sp. S26]MCE6999640.1 3-keto-5-aminohexanoate cleavage protein [Saccharothrix sp. S26]